MNTSFLDRCCSVLETAKQYKSDELLVRLVRVQRLAQCISLTLALEPDQQAMQLPMTIVVQSFQDQINALRAQQSPELESNCTCSDNPLTYTETHTHGCMHAQISS